MRILSIPEDDGGGLGPAAIALGNFDGVHLGHRAVIDLARRAAADHRVRFGVATFEPAPRRYFQPNAEPFRLLTPSRRAKVLASIGVEACYLLRFDRDLVDMSDADFVSQRLVNDMNVKAVAVGADFRFGHDRMGDAGRLAELGRATGIDVRIQSPIKLAGHDEKISSSDIRLMIIDGDMPAVRHALGETWVVDGVVVPGERRGRTLGFPTANFQLGEIVHPAHGVYATWARLDPQEPWRPAVSNFGRTPTTGLRDPLLETMILDFEGDLYGRTLEVGFAQRIRPELRFDSLDALVAAMDVDVQKARTILRAAPRPTA